MSISKNIIVWGVILTVIFGVPSYFIVKNLTFESSVSKQSESHIPQHLRDKLLLESAETLVLLLRSTETLLEMDERLKRMEQDLREIREKLVVKDLEGGEV